MEYLKWQLAENEVSAKLKRSFTKLKSSLHIGLF